MLNIFHEYKDFFFGWVLRHTNTVKVIWPHSSFTGRGRPRVLLRALFQAQAGNPRRTTNVPLASRIASSHEKNPKSLAGFEPTAARDKRF